MATRTYHLHAVIGQGGFGRVYRATLGAAGGFQRQVAVKLLLGDAAENPKVLQRFRDEARILGLVRDRAFVAVEPPVRLGGQWAVVMDYIEGESARALQRHGPYPTTVALELVEEVARALGAAYRMPGPDGRPLEVLHRDLKPGNLQVTPNGEVRILDLGIAKASFDAREAQTIDDHAGTVGYAAPERFEGIDTPAGDVFSLGIVLRVLLTGDKPLGAGSFKAKGTPPADAADAMALAEKMYEIEAEDRPTMRQVEDRCRAVRRGLTGPSLREWAEQVVQAGRSDGRDERCGLVFTEEDEPGNVLPLALGVQPSGGGATGATLAPAGTRSLDTEVQSGASSTDTQVQTGNTSTKTLTQVSVLLGGGLFATVFGGGVLLLGAVLMLKDSPWLAGGADEPDVADVVEVPAPAPVAPPAPATAPVAPAPTEPAPTEAVAPAVAPAPAAAPAPATPKPAAPAPAPEPVAVAPAPAPAPVPEAPAVAEAPEPAPPAFVETVMVTFLSVPLSATVTVDGQYLGKTPLNNRPLAVGKHTLRMELGDSSSTHTIEIGPKLPKRFRWTGGDNWELLP